MKDKLIKQYDLKHTASTKWNEVYESDEYIMIWNRVTGDFKVKKNYKKCSNYLNSKEMKNLTANELRQALREPEEFFKSEEFSEFEKRGLTADAGLLRRKKFKGIAYRKGSDNKIKLVETR